eukprot:scaffold15851_cov146-Isochrysis_galbana.AAC.4
MTHPRPMAMPGRPHPQPQPSHQASLSGPGCMRRRRPALEPPHQGGRRRRGPPQLPVSLHRPGRHRCSLCRRPGRLHLLRARRLLFGFWPPPRRRARRHRLLLSRCGCGRLAAVSIQLRVSLRRRRAAAATTASSAASGCMTCAPPSPTPATRQTATGGSSAHSPPTNIDRLVLHKSKCRASPLILEDERGRAS